MSHLPLKQIDPLTTGTLSITVTDSAGAVVTGATVTAKIYAPSGQLVASGVSFSEAGGGVYSTTIQAGWSDAGSGVPILGVFRAVVTVVKSSQQRTKNFLYLVNWTE